MYSLIADDQAQQTTTVVQPLIEGKRSGFKGAFERVDSWGRESGAATRNFGLQLYDRNFDPKNPESILHIYVPLRE